MTCNLPARFREYVVHVLNLSRKLSYIHFGVAQKPLQKSMFIYAFFAQQKNELKIVGLVGRQVFCLYYLLIIDHSLIFSFLSSHLILSTLVRTSKFGLNLSSWRSSDCTFKIINYIFIVQKTYLLRYFLSVT